MSRRILSMLPAAAIVAAACVGDPPERSEPEPSPTGPERTAAEPEPGPEPGEPTFDLVEPVPDPAPIPPSDDVRIGVLDNGLTYYVRRNDRPGNSLSLRLVVNAGSLQQEVPESGGAHFLEHMLFNGTERWPGNEMDRVLQRLGVELGPDLNAFTSYDETVYRLDIAAIGPSVDDEEVSTAFDVLSEWASRATITAQDTIEERGVVREEIRLRDEGPQGALSLVFDAAYHNGTAYERREPGGRQDLILETEADQLRAFYDRWYRPDLMAVVAVGDLPVDEMEADIVARFTDLTSRGDDRERVEPIVPPIDTPFTDVVTHPELPSTFLSLDYSLTDWRTGTVGGERLTLIQDLFAQMIQTRLQEASDRGDVELIDPFVGRVNLNRAQPILGFNVDGPELATVTEYVLTELRRIELAGFTEEELDRARTAFTAALDQALAAAPTTEDRVYADRYVDHYLRGSQISSVADTHARLTEVLAQLTAAEITDVFRWELSRAAPLIIVAGPDPAALPSVADLEAAVAAAGAPSSGGARADDERAIDQLMTAPAPVEPVETVDIEELSAVEWVFDNGVTVRFVESDIVADQVAMQAVSEGGWSVLPPNEARLAPSAVAAVAGSGVGEYDRLGYRRFLAGTTARLGPFIDETTEGFGGSASVDDLEFLFQRLHLAVTEPRVDEASLIETISNGEEARRAAESDPNFATSVELADVIFSGDERYSGVPPRSLDSLTAEAALDLYRQRFGTVDDLIVAIAGDVDRELVGDLAARYLGTLPAGPADSWIDVRPPPFEGVVNRRVVAGRGEATGAVALYYPSAVDVDARTRIELMVVRAILDARLFDVVREELGASYGGTVAASPEVDPREGVGLALFANGDPERVEEILQVMLDESADLAANGPTADELERARSIIAADFELTSNAQWIQMLLTEPDEEILTVTRRAELLAEVDAADVQALAATVLPAGNRAEILTVPR